MKKQFVKTALALAVASTLAAPAFAVDGVDEKGSARSQALQLNYFTHADKDNIWVNPAMASEFRNSAEFTSGDNKRGGFLFGLGEQHTVGVYMRDKASNFGEVLSFKKYDNNAFGDLDGGLIANLPDSTFPPFTSRQTDLKDTTDNSKNPENLFDVFYSMDMGDMAFGARLNFQNYTSEKSNPARTGAYTGEKNAGNLDASAISNTYMLGTNTRLTENNQDLDAPVFNDLTATSLKAKLDQQIAANEAARLTGNAPSGHNYTGNIIEVKTSGGKWETDASEMNIALGFNLKSIGIDGAVQFGKASGSQTRTTDFSNSKNEYAIDTSGTKAVQKTRLTESGSEQWKDDVSIDDGNSLAVSLRGLVMETDKSTLHVSGHYSTRDYSGSLVSTHTMTETKYDNWVDTAVSGNDWGKANTTILTESSKRWEGSRTNEEDVIQLGTAFRTMMTDATAVTAAVAFNITTNTTGMDRRLVNDTKKISTTNTNTYNTTNNTNSTTSTNYNNSNSNIGLQSKFEQEVETMSLPLTLAVEHSFNERWVARGSVSKPLYTTTEVTRTDYNYQPAVANSRTEDRFNNTVTAAATRQTVYDNSTKSGADRNVEAAKLTTKTETTWNQKASVALGLGYTNNGMSIDAVVESGNDTFGAITLGYKW